MMLLSIAFFLGAAAAADPQDIPPLVKTASPGLVRSADPEYDALRLRYEAAIHDYDDLRIRRDRKGSDEPDPPLPARVYHARFLELARKDVGGAQGWVLENLKRTVDDPKERVAIARELMPKLLAKHADEDAVLHAVTGLKAIYDDFPDESEIQAIAASIVDKSPIDEIKASGLMLEAWIRSRGESTTDPERLKDKEDILRSVLYGFPKTPSGKEVSGYFYGVTLKRFLEAERAWVDEVMRLQAAGKAPEQWPPQPLAEYAELFRPIAAANHHSAGQVVNKLYPAYEQAARQSLGFGLQWLANELGVYYSDGSEGPWNILRADLITALYRQYPTEKWVYGSIKRTTGAVEVLPPAKLEPGLAVLLEKNKDQRVLAWTTFCLAQCAKMSGDQKGYQRAIELFAKVRADFPDSEVSQAAEDGRAELARVMPGAPAPFSQPVLDEDGQPWSVAAYKGRAVLLDIWSFRTPDYLTDGVPARAALLRELEGKPFSLVGVNVDSQQRDAFRERATKAGISWRCSLSNFTDPFVQSWEVRTYPTTILIDKKGIIRARNLPWPEMTALASKLAAE
jgi:hypothetical protein